MSTDNTGVQTRAMAQCTDSEPQETQNQNLNPTVELYKSKDESIKDFIRKHGTIALDWYVPNFSNTRVGDLIEQRLPIETADGRIVFSCPTLSELFRTSNFELDRNRTNSQQQVCTGRLSCKRSKGMGTPL